MITRRTSAKSIMEAIENKMVEVTEVTLNHKNLHKSESLLPDMFVNDLKSLSNLHLFSDSIDFEYELICDNGQIDNERIQILCGYNNYIIPHCINAILKLNKSVCKSTVLLEKILTNK